MTDNLLSLLFYKSYLKISKLLLVYILTCEINQNQNGILNFETQPYFHSSINPQFL